jgi:A/G-specific adenine glycosylase
LDIKESFSFDKDEIAYFQKTILNWFEEHKRDFPWRAHSMSNYGKIISEVFLQRTKAETVAKFFPSFISKYPSWKQLSNVTEDELKEIMKPLGLYNQRGARLYKLAQELKKRNGRFPSVRSEVEEMGMMGQYITNAFELFVLKKPAPLLDVNMARVLERYFGKRKMVDIRYDPYLQALSLSVVSHEQYKEINWAILDFGALVCKARNPLCDNCPLKNRCKYFKRLTSKFD